MESNPISVLNLAVLAELGSIKVIHLMREGWTPSHINLIIIVPKDIMIKELKEYVMVQIELNDMDTDLISSYSVSMKASGVFQLVIFFSLKVERGKKTRIHIPLDSDIENAKITHDVMAEILVDTRTKTLAEKIKKTRIEPKGWE